jgi:hypothetical protein
MTIALLIAGYLFIVVGVIAILIEAFRESVLWGVACLLLPVVTFFFVIVHWRVAKTGFMIQFFGLALVIIGLAFGPDIETALG